MAATRSSDVPGVTHKRAHRPKSTDLLTFGEPRPKLTLIDDNDEEDVESSRRAPAERTRQTVAPPPPLPRATTVFPTRQPTAIPGVSTLRVQAQAFMPSGGSVRSLRRAGLAVTPGKTVFPLASAPNPTAPASRARLTVFPQSNSIPQALSINVPTAISPVAARVTRAPPRPPIRISKPAATFVLPQRRDSVDKHIAEVEAGRQANSHLVHPRPIRLSPLVNPPSAQRGQGRQDKSHLFPCHSLPSSYHTPAPSNASAKHVKRSGPASPPPPDHRLWNRLDTSLPFLDKDNDLTPPTSYSSRANTPVDLDPVTACGQSIIPQTAGDLAGLFQWHYPCFPSHSVDTTASKKPELIKKPKRQKGGDEPARPPLAQLNEYRWIDSVPFVKARLVNSVDRATSQTPLSGALLSARGYEAGYTNHQPTNLRGLVSDLSTDTGMPRLMPVTQEEQGDLLEDAQIGSEHIRSDTERSTTDQVHIGVLLLGGGARETPIEVHERLSGLSLDELRTRDQESRFPPPASDNSAEFDPYEQLLAMPPVRALIPPSISNTVDRLQRSMIASWRSAEPSVGRKRQILKLKHDLGSAINRYLCPSQFHIRGRPRFSVDVFGSVSWGGETGTSGDLDLVVRDRHLPRGYTPMHWQDPIQRNRSGTLPPVYNIRRLRELIAGMYGSDAKGVPWANAPIVKFTDRSSPQHPLECDVNVNDLGGWYNSRLIQEYCDYSKYILRPLIHALKLWSSAHFLNNSGGGGGPSGMSSYCLTLMAISFLQRRGALPNLQADVAAPAIDDPEVADDEWTVWVNWGKPVGQKAHVKFTRGGVPGWKPRNPEYTAAQALRDFFDYYRPSNPLAPFVPAYQITSILHGGVLDRTTVFSRQGKKGGSESQARSTPSRASGDLSRMGKGDRGIQPRDWQDKLLVVQDPFIWQKNCAGSMSLDSQQRWFRATEKAYEILSRDPHATLGDILADPEPRMIAVPKTKKNRKKGSPDRGSTPLSHGSTRSGPNSRPGER